MAGRRRPSPNAATRLQSGGDQEPRWLLLIHQIPPKPAYLRVKVWRRLQRLGAAALKNSVYVLPARDSTLEDFQWVRREIVDEGGDATICAARFVDGLSDEQVQALFHAARDSEYGQIVDEARRLGESFVEGVALDAERSAELTGHLGRLKRRLRETAAIDFFGAPGHEAAEALISGLEARLGAAQAPTPRSGGSELHKAPSGAVWVTRQGIHVDRIASAWLIRRFIDRRANFVFVAAKTYRPKPGELRFDMFEAEYTHEGERCTFEVLLDRFGLDDFALRAIAEIVHDLDLKDGKFGRPEVAGVDRVVAGITLAHKDDTARLERGAAVLDDLYEYFRRQRPASRVARSGG
ncbi:MAG: chromate resistance protein [Proteobacteria bacterium]|nr:chromate resistance protein [Pseudomonadota bacterium]